MQLVAKTNEPVNGQDERATPAVDSPACLCFPVIKRATARSAAALSHYPERGNFMDCTEAYKEHIEYTFNAFCRVVIRYAAINAWRNRDKRRQREISFEYLTEEKFYPFSTTGYQIRRALQLLHKEMEVLLHGESEPFTL